MRFLIPLILILSNFISDDAALSLAVQVYGKDARISKVFWNGSIVTPFSVSPPGEIIQYCVGVQEYFPSQLQTPVGILNPPNAGQPLQNITWKGCGSSWDDAFVVILKTAK